MMNSAFRRRVLRVGIVLVAAQVGVASAAALRQFAPQGQVDRQTRATAQFTADMVPLGQPEAAAPFTVDCGGIAGKGRWSDARNWSYVIERPLEPGERCDFRLRPGLKAANGEAVGGEAHYAFFAPGPWPRSLTPRPGNGIEEDQAFVIEASGELKPESVTRNVWCEAEGVGQRIPVRQVEPAVAAAVLDSVGRARADGALVIACQERLPPGARMKLVWGKGVESVTGVRSAREESFSYRVREPFRASFSCEREKASQPCSPLSDLRLQFSAQVDHQVAAKLRLLTPEGVRSPAGGADAGERQNMTGEVVFKRPFPQNAELTLELPPGLKDEAGRPLENAGSFPLKVRTGTLPPLAKFPGSFGIVELNEGGRRGGVLPVTVRNVEASLALASRRLVDDDKVIAMLRELPKFERQTKKLRIGSGKEARAYEDPFHARELRFLDGADVRRQTLPKPGGPAEFEVMGIPLEQPGYHVVEIESRLLGAALLAQPQAMYVRTAVLVTNLAVHLKRGRDNALVWVTSLDGGKPVAGAAVRVADCSGRELWSGRTDASGRASIDRALVQRDCGGENFVFASARLGDDFSFVRSDWNEGIEPWRFGVDTWGEARPRTIHAIFDRTLLRAGQTVSMKLVARDRDSRGLAIPAAKSLPPRATLRHDGSGDEFRVDLAWDAQGSATAQWKIPESAKRGTYSVDVPPIGQVGEFRVSDFRLPVFAGSVQGIPGRQVAPKQVPLALGLSFLNGGAAKNHAVQVSATLRPRWPEFSRYDRFRFAVDFDESGQGAFGIDDGREHEQLVLDKQALTLDQAGAGKLTVALPGRVRGPGELYAEMSFADPNGEIQTLRGTVELWPAAVVAGIRVKDWVGVTDRGSVEVIVLDTAGKPVAGAPVRVLAKRRVDYSHRKRIVGGFYTYERQTEFVDLGEVCNGRSDARGMISCTPKTDTPGNVYLLAEARDDSGNSVRAGTSYWVAGAGDLWFAAGNQDRIDVIPEKQRYAPGQTARFQVRTPFREASALIAVEAGGIIETFVRPLSRFNPVIELPVRGEWGPNVYVSILAVRGRVEPLKWYSIFDWGWREPLAWFREWWNPQQPSAMVDLAKPAFRIGLAQIEVGTDAFRLKVDVTPEKRDYRPREQASVRIRVTAPDGKSLPAGSEVALAAVDQALLELRPNDSWDLLTAMLQKRGYEVETATAQSQVIGKRHFGRKAVPPGGGGGRAPARELFDTLLLWNPHVLLDASGSATVSVPINDSLSEFKLVAVATAGPALFGTGSGSLRTRQDLQLISGLPPLVRETDRFDALLTLRNGTARPMTVKLEAKVGGKALESRELKLEAEGASEQRWSAQVAEGETALVWEFEASDKDSAAKDRLRITQQVAPAVPLTVQQASLMRIDGKLELAAQPPANALSGKGGIEVGLSPKLSTPPPGLRRFFEEYPFACLEQKTSVAVGLRDTGRWQQVVANLPTYLDGQGLARYFPGSGSGSPVLTAYLLTTAHAAGFELPAELAARMEQGLRAFAEGRVKPEHWAPAQLLQLDLTARKLAALEALSRRGHKVTPLLATLDLEPARLPTAALIDWLLVARRSADLPERAARLAAAERELRNRLSYAGGRLVFTSESADYWWWLMVNGDLNGFRLIEAVIDEPAWQQDLPALVQGAMQRQQRGRWLTTVANVWATIALERFGRKFEREVVSGTTTAALGKAAALTHAWKGDAEPAPAKLALPWPQPADPAAKLQLAHKGGGKPWAAVQVLAAVPVRAPQAYGFKVRRDVTPVQEKTPGKPTRGDVWRVRLSVESDQEMAWVVLDDPIPAGARILGEGDGRDSQIAGMGEREGGRAWPVFVERTFSSYRAYYSQVPRGRFYIDYTLRLNNAGEFTLPATRVEAMYAPEVFGEQPNAKLTVKAE